MPGNTTKSVRTKVAAERSKDRHGVNRFPVAPRIAIIDFSNIMTKMER